MVKAIIFDLDGTLIDRQRAFEEMLLKRLREMLKDEDDSKIKEMVKDILEFDDFGAVSRFDSFSKWIEKYHIQGIDPQDFALEWSKVSGSTCYLYDGVIPTLQKLKGKYKIAVLSNGDTSSQRRKMSTINIDSYLDFSLISGEFGSKKPDPSIFKYTCDKLHLEPGECLYVGDSYYIDVVGSRNAGLKPLYINTQNREHKDVDTIYKIEEIIDYLEREK